MEPTSILYNKLPSLAEANQKFRDRDDILKRLASVFAKHDRRFGVSLIHSHCKLEQGEKMVAEGPISQPERNVECFPEHWLATGEAYEFTKKPTISPPSDLLTEFQSIIGDIGVLGICFVANEDRPTGIMLERTEGRMNIIEQVEESPSNTIATCWLLGPDMKLNASYICDRGLLDHTTGCFDDSDSEDE